MIIYLNMFFFTYINIFERFDVFNKLYNDPNSIFPSFKKGLSRWNSPMGLALILALLHESYVWSHVWKIKYKLISNLSESRI